MKVRARLTPKEMHQRVCAHNLELLSIINDAWSPNLPYEKAVLKAIGQGLSYADIAPNLTAAVLEEVFVASRFRHQVRFLVVMAEQAMALHAANPELTGFKLSGEADAAVMGFMTFAVTTDEIEVLKTRCEAQQQAFADLLGLEFPYVGRPLEG